MKSVLFIAAISLLVSCTKESTENNGGLLKSIMANGAISQSFEYNADGKLVKENNYLFCDHPADEFTYSYSNNSVSSTESVIRSLYSGTAAICDPASGMHAFETYEYDDQQRIKKIIREKSTTTYTYNSAGLVERADHTDGINTSFSTYKYDSRNNLIEEYGSQGQGVNRYEFDTKKNPFYYIKSRPDLITAFNISPNNVVKVIDESSSQLIRYEYNAAGFLVKMFDENGSTYLYQYR